MIGRLMQDKLRALLRVGLDGHPGREYRLGGSRERVLPV